MDVKTEGGMDEQVEKQAESVWGAVRRQTECTSTVQMKAEGSKKWEEDENNSWTTKEVSRIKVISMSGGKGRGKRQEEE